MAKKTTCALGLCLVFAASGQAVNFTRDSGDPRWSNLGQWNDNASGSYQDSTNFPTPSDLVLLNAGKVLSVDTNAFARTVVIPNAANTSATLVLTNEANGYTLTANGINVGIASQLNSMGDVYQSAGTVQVGTTTVAGSGTGSGSYHLWGGELASTALNVGSSVAGATGRAGFMQSGGSVSTTTVRVGGVGKGTYTFSGGVLDVAGILDLRGTGLWEILGVAGTIRVNNLRVQPGSEMDFVLDASGVSSVQVAGSVALAAASIRVDGLAYEGSPTNIVLLEAGTLTSMPPADQISIIGLADATVSPVGNSVVLSIAKSKNVARFENSTGDGLWGTPGNWSLSVVPKDGVLAVVDGGLIATIATPAPAVDGVTVDGNATLAVQSDFPVADLRVGVQRGGVLSIDGAAGAVVSGDRLAVGSQGTVEFKLGAVGLSPMSLTGTATLDEAGRLIIDGADYEGLDGYFPLIRTTGFTGDLSWTNHITFVGLDERAPAAVIQADGLWLRLIAPPSFSARLCSLVPPSTVATDYAGTQFSATRAYEPSGSAWSLTLSEAHVMDTRLAETVVGEGADVRSWELRVARGGNIYSLRTPALGETVPPSYRGTGDTSPWNDEVWQGVAVDTSQNDPPASPYFTHQSGVYLKDPSLTEPFYSPQVAAHLNQEERSFTTINWIPQAHINIYTDSDPANDFKSYLLMFTRYRDLGQGVIEVSLGYYNYGPDTLDFLNMPWGGVRRTSTEYAFLSDPGGTTWSDPQTNNFGPVTRHFNLTGGWMGFSASPDGATPALGFVYGLDHATPLPAQSRDFSTFRWGYAGGKGSYRPTETDWRNYFVTSTIRWYDLTEGRGVWSRYYFVLGDGLTDLAGRISARGLVDAQLREFVYTEQTSPLIACAVSGSGAHFRVGENSRSPDFFLYAHPINDTLPVFEILEADGSRYLTWNPYADGIVKPYDGRLAGIRLLGFASQTAGTSGTHAPLADLLPAINYMPDGKTLFVRMATPLESWRVEYFGFPQDAGAGANAADSDHDAANNLYEYGFGGNPTDGTDIGYRPTYGMVAEGGTNFLEYVHARRTTAGHGLLYRVESTDDLVSGTWTSSDVIELPVTGRLDPDFEAVTNRIDLTGRAALFVRLRIDLL